MYCINPPCMPMCVEKSKCWIGFLVNVWYHPEKSTKDTKSWRQKNKETSSPADSLVHFLIWMQQPKSSITQPITDVFLWQNRIENVPFVMWLVSTEDVTFKSKPAVGWGGLKPIKLSDLIPHFPPSVQISCSPSFMFYWANTFVCSSSWNYIVCSAWISPWFCPSRHKGPQRSPWFIDEMQVRIKPFL